MEDRVPKNRQRQRLFSSVMVPLLTPWLVLHPPLTIPKVCSQSQLSSLHCVFATCPTSTQSSIMITLFFLLLSLLPRSHCLLSFIHIVQLRYFTKTLVLISYYLELDQWPFNLENALSLHLQLQTALCLCVKLPLVTCF